MPPSATGWLALTVVGVRGSQRSRGITGVRRDPGALPRLVPFLVVVLTLVTGARIAWTLPVALVVVTGLAAGAVTTASGILDGRARVRWMREHL